MEDGKPLLPLAVTTSSGVGGVSAPFTIVQNAVAGPAEVLERAVAQFTGAEAYAAVGTFRTGIEGMARTFEKASTEASCSAHAMHALLFEGVRNNAEEALRFVQDLAGARAPSDVFALQTAYFNRQMHLFFMQAQDFQAAFANFFSYLG